MKDMKQEKKQIIILGAGYGGLRTALKLNRLLKNQRYWQVLLVDQHDQHELRTELHEVAAGKADIDAIRIPIARILKNKRIEFVKSEVTHIDFNQQTVTTTSGKIKFDKLVIALGSQTEFFGIPGLSAHAFTLNSLEDAEKIKNYTKQMFVQAKKETDGTRRKALLTFIIGGAGFTGVELATEFVIYLKKLSKEFHTSLTEVQLFVIEATPSILPDFDPELVKVAERIMESMGIRLLLNTPCVSVEDNLVHLKSGEIIQSYTLIWTGGVRANDLVAESGLKYGPRSRVIVNPYLESVDHPGVFVIGDNALVHDPKTNRPVAPTAQLALQQAEFAAENIYAEIRGTNRRIYIPKISGQFVSLGDRNAAGWIWKFKVTGFLAWVLKRMTVVRYLYSIGGLSLIIPRIWAIFSR